MRLSKIVVFMLCIVTFAVNAQKNKSNTKPKVTQKTPPSEPAPVVVPKAETPQAEVNNTKKAEPVTIPMAERATVEISAPTPRSTPSPATKVPTYARKDANAERAAMSDSLSVHPIDPSNILYRITNWRRMDLKEKINQPFFSKNNEITKFLIDGVRNGKLVPYSNDSLNTVLSLEAFNKNLLMENTGGDGLSEEEKKAGFGDANTTKADDGWGGANDKPKSTTPAKTNKPSEGVDDGWGNIVPAKGANTANSKGAANDWSNGPSASAGANVIEYFARDLTILEIKEDFIFDKQRSRAYNSIQTITIVIPAEKTTRGFDVPVASFRYKDLHNYFKANPKAIWYNFKNISQHRNMSDAFDLRLFNARIIKQSNPTDSYLVDIYKGDQEGLRASELLEHKLMEFEHNLWEY
jgi:hypothetical protein